MPMIDLFMPEGALEPDARAEAVERLTQALLRHEGAPQDNRYVEAMAWTLVHEMPREAFNVAGRPADRPFYRVMVTVPEGTLLQGPGLIGTQARKNLVREVTEILLEAEGTEYSDVESGRVYCLIQEIEDGYWGGVGSTFRMADIVATAAPEAPQTELSGRAREAIDGLLSISPPAA